MIGTARLRLRPLASSDAALLPALVTPMVSELTANWAYPFTLAMAEERMAQVLAANESGRAFNRIIETRDGGTVMGWLGVIRTETAVRRGNLGYWLNDGFHRQGYLTEALPPFLHAAVAALRLEELEAGAQHRNAASIAALRRLGMQYAGDRMVFVPARQREEQTAFYRLDLSAFRPSR